MDPPPAVPGKSTHLNPDHTHFVMVEKDGGNWGCELGLRAQLELTLAEMLAVPIVQLCVQARSRV